MPVVEHMELMENIGIASTPTIFRRAARWSATIVHRWSCQVLLEAG